MRSGRKIRPAETVDEYIAGAPERMRKALRDIRRTIKGTAPDAEEKISYHMPSYKYHGQLVYFAAFMDHLSLFPASHSTVKKFRKRLKGFDVSGTTIHFTPEKPLPAPLVKAIVRARMKENELRAKRKK